MVKNRIITIVLGILIVLLIIFLIVINVPLGSNIKVTALDGTKEYVTNVHDDIIKEQEVDGLIFKDANLVYQEGNGSVLEVNVVNETDKTYYLNGVSAIMKDENDGKIVTLTSDNYIKLQPDGKILYVLKTDKDLSSLAYSVEYKLAYQE